VTSAAAPSPPTVRLAHAVYGDGPTVGDPAELLHEVSKFQPSLLPRQLEGATRLLRDPALLASSARAVRRNRSLPSIELPQPRRSKARLADVVARRRSARSFGPEPLPLATLAGLLDAAYGVTAAAENGLPPLRSVPSAGALYPLELYVLAHRVEGLEPAVYHFDPLRRRLEQHATPVADAAESRLFPEPSEPAAAAAILVVAAVFWRSRIKYGLRAYRFTLLEAGHATQNLLLAATAHELASFVLGGFYDARLDSLLGLNGVDESSIVAVCVGERA
jgi:SagB-type dehydrogenase family enzyme